MARSSGVALSTLRFYERKGLVKPQGRSSNGYREYAAEAVVRVRFIQRAQTLGFSLREVQSILRMSEGRVPSRSQLERLAHEKLAAIDARMKDLQRVKRAIARLIAQGGPDPDKPCPILHALGE